MKRTERDCASIGGPHVGGIAGRGAYVRLLPAAFLLALAPAAFSQSILTIAGGGTDDGRPALLAGLDTPTSVAVDAAGNLYVADTDNHRIRKVSAATGTITTVAGNGTAGFTGDGGQGSQAAIDGPRAVAVDAAGHVYIADEGNNRIRRVDANTGVITTIAGTGLYGSGGDGGPAMSAQFVSTSGIAVSRSGDIYIVDAGANKVRKISATTRVITLFAGNGTWGFTGDGGPATAATFRLSGDTSNILSIAAPPSIALDEAGNAYISDTFNHRIRRVDSSGIITTVAGTGASGFSGDGGSALAARLDWPGGMAIDRNNSLLIADANNDRIRRIPLTSGTITTFAGNGVSTFGGDGGPALAASIASPYGVAATASGDVIIADTFNDRIRRVSSTSLTITTVAGSGARFSGDGGPATAAVLYHPVSIAIDSAGSLFVSEYYGHRIRKITRDRKISTVAGTGIFSSGSFIGDGGPATSAGFGYPGGVAVDGAGNLYVADLYNNRIRRITGGFIATVIGTGARGYSGDGGPATAAQLNMASNSSSSIVTGSPAGVVIAPNGDIYFSDTFNYRVRKVAAQTQIISTVAGTGTAGYSGDGGAATAAQLDRPSGLAIDRNSLYIADYYNNRIRRVDLGSGLISTVAGSGPTGAQALLQFGGDGGPATSAFLARPTGVSVDAAGNLYIADKLNRRIRKVSGGTITTIAGAGTRDSGFTGDGGPALSAGLSNPNGVTVDSSNNVYIADSESNRVRALLACAGVTAPRITAPNSGAAVNTAPTLSWEAATGAFRYDLYVSPSNPPALVAADLTATSYTLSNLLPGTTYFWRSVAKSDPFCTPPAVATSETRSFTTTPECAAPPAPVPSQPADGGANLPRALQLIWQSVPGASTYDLYFGPTTPPPLLTRDLSATSQSVGSLALDTAYSWFVVAHAACDPSKTTVGPTRTFRTEGGCVPATTFNLLSPQNGGAGVPLTTTFSWAASSNASSYDLYLGPAESPALYLPDLQKTSVTVAGLAPSTRYSWRVVARVACDSSKSVTTTVSAFTTGTGCIAPGTPSISFVPPGNVGVGQTYTVAWKELPDLDATGFYIVERSLSSSFSSVVDSQETFSTSASFLSSSAGTYYHRVRAMAGCDSRPGPASESRPVTVITGPGNIIFTVQPQAAITALGEKLEEKRGTFTLENISTEPLQVIVGKGEINSVPFFAISDPLGGDAVFVTLEPRKPKAFQINFSGPPNDLTAAYQGIIFVAATGQGLAITPYAFVNLKVGGGATSRPQFRVNGQPSDLTFFPGLAGPDESRPPITVGIRNNGTAPMELGAEIGPEVWLVPEGGWNSAPIPPGATRDVKLTTQRSRAPNKSALPRYTYFTVRSKNGESARLLVQDNDAPPTAFGRTSLLEPGSRSFIVPFVMSSRTSYSRVRLTNVGSEAVQTDFYFTPAGADGFDSARVKRATLVLPPNDVVTLTDPLLQLFGLPQPAEGQLEVRGPSEKIGFLIVNSSIVTPSSSGGAYAYDIPTYLLGEGTRIGSPLSAAGITSNADTRATMILAETTGTDAVSVRLALFDSTGGKKSESIHSVPRYGVRSVDVGTLTGGLPIDGARLETTVDSGGGAVAVLVTMVDAATGSGAAAITPAPSAAPIAVGSLFRVRLATTPSVSAVVPVVASGPVPGKADTKQRTTLGFTTSGASQLTVTVTYRPNTPGSSPVEKSLTLFPGVIVQFEDALGQLFGLPQGLASEGSVFINAALGAQIYARLQASIAGGKWLISGRLPIVPTLSDVLTSARARRPLYLDGLEQSIDPARGTRWAVILNEISGSSGVVAVRVYEAGNRSFPIAEKRWNMGAYQQLKLDTVFAELGLDTEERRKDRTNVLAVVTAESGNAVVTAVGVGSDNVTGDTTHVVFSPGGGVPATGAVRLSTVTPVSAPAPAQPSRRRAVKP